MTLVGQPGKSQARVPRRLGNGDGPSGRAGRSPGSGTVFRGRLLTSESVDVLQAAYRIEGDRLHLSDLTVEGSADAGPCGVVWTTHPLTRHTG